MIAKKDPREGLATIVALALVAAASPTGATPPSPPTADSVDRFAQCAVGNYEGAELLATQPGSEEEKDVFTEFGRRSCTVPQVGFGLLRGAVAEHLFNSDFGAIGAQPRRDLIEVFIVDSSELAGLDEKARSRIDYVAFGTCAAASDPERAAGLLKTSAESKEERKILSELVPSFASCLAKGEQFTLARADLRAALAEGIYRLALSQSLDDEVVVTATRDPSRRVRCKLENASGTRMRRNVCLTEAQWSERKRASEQSAEDLERQAREYRDIETTILARTRFGSSCLDAGLC